MSQVVTISVGRLLSRNEKLTTAKINAIVKSIVINLSGIIGTVDLADGAVTPVKASPGAWFYAAAALAGDTYSATYNPAYAAHTDGTWLTFKAGTANPVNPLFDAGPGAKPLYKYGGRYRLEAGDIPVNSIVTVRYNSTVVAGGCWEVMSLIGLPPIKAPFIPASPYLSGEMGLVPPPPPSARRKYLTSQERSGSVWGDESDLATTTAALVTAETGFEIFKQKNFI